MGILTDRAAGIPLGSQGEFDGDFLHRKPRECLHLTGIDFQEDVDGGTESGVDDEEVIWAFGVFGHAAAGLMGPGVPYRG